VSLILSPWNAMKSVLFFTLVLSLACLGGAQFYNTEGPTNGGLKPPGPAPPCQRPNPITCFDPNCFCQFDWLGPPGDSDSGIRLNDIFYGSWFDFDNWSPAPILFNYPCDVCFVSIGGAGTTFIDTNAKVNTLTLGGNQWDFVNVFLGGAGRSLQNVTLTVGYNDIPTIKRVDGVRLCNGQTLLTITGTGFGFCALDLNITVTDYTYDRDQWEQYEAQNCDYPEGCDYTGVPSIIPDPGITYTCENIRIFYLDQKISCYVSIPDVFAQQLQVTVTLNLRNPPLSDTVNWLTTYVK